MDKWVRNIIGLSIAALILIMTWRVFGKSTAEISAKSNGTQITFKISDSVPPVAQNLLPIEKSEPKSYSFPENGVEKWESQKVTVNSGWRKGGSSQTEFCAAQQNAIRKLSQGSRVLLVSTSEKHKSEYTPFKQDFYLYSCNFEIQNPVYHREPN